MSIAEKLTLAAENVPKVYEAGYNEGEQIAHNKPYIDTSKITNYSEMFAHNKYSYEDLEKFDTSNSTSFDCLFGDGANSTTNTKLTKIPLFDTSKGITFRLMFCTCKSITEIPFIDTSNGTDFSNMFYYCTKLTSVPLLNTSKGTKFNAMFAYCSTLTEIPAIDTSNGTNFDGMFQSCSKLTYVPNLNTSKATNLGSLFNGCSSLENFPELDTSTTKTFYQSFSHCTKLKSIPIYDSSNSTNFGSTFSFCSALEVAPELDTSKGTSFGYMFQYCTSLKTVPKINVSKATGSSSLNNMFYNCTALEEITFEGTINIKISFKESTNLTHNSLVGIINALKTYSSTSSNYTLTLGSTNLAKLTDEEKAVATAKGWRLS